MPKAKKTASGKYRCRVYSHADPDGKKHYKSFTAPTKKEAEFQASEYLLLRNRAKDNRNWTLGEAIDHYIELKRPVLSPSAIYGYEQIRKTAFQNIMEVAIDRLDSNTLQQAVNDELRRIPKNKTTPISAKTVRNEYGLISSSLRRYLPDRTYHVDLPKQARRIRSLPLPEAVYKAVKGTDVELAVLLAMWLSFTLSEVRGLSKSKSIDGDYITIREVVVNVGNVDTRKDLAKEVTRNRRHKMPRRIKELIEDVEGDVIVPMHSKTITRHFQKYLKQAGIEPITFHDLRHINASVMAMLRIPDKYAQERGGWSTDHVMKSVYMETFSQERERVDKLIDDYFDGII